MKLQVVLLGLMVGLSVASQAAEDPVQGAHNGEEGKMMVVDFAGDEPPWRSIDDVVMGGVSRSDMVVKDGIATFRGEVSLENNGGFASVRSMPEVHDLRGYDGLVLRVRGDGNRYAFRLRNSAAFDGASFQVRLRPPPGEWVEIAIPFSDFVPVFRGRRLAGHPPLDPSRIMTFGLLISDKQEGPFQLDIQWIRGWNSGEGGSSGTETAGEP
jgi:monofunctional biosynthetic peptidoglycan transglycosylase